MAAADKIKILIVDDEHIVLTALKRELEAGGFEVEVSQSGKQAVDIVKREKIAIAYLDLVMPEMDGVQACAKILEASPETEVVLLSGAPEDIQTKQYEFFEAGGRDELLRKPLDQGEIVQVTKKILEEKESHKE